MSLSSTWFAHPGDEIEAAAAPPTVDGAGAFATLRFHAAGSSAFDLAQFAIQSHSATALRDIAAAATNAAALLDAASAVSPRACGGDQQR